MNFKRALLILMALMLLPALATAQEPGDTIRMEVNKIWVDTDLDVWDNPLQPVTVQLTCNTGLPLQQQAEITQAQGVVFVVEEVVDILDVTCTVDEISESIPGFLLWSVAQDGIIPDDLEVGGCVFNLGDLDLLNSCLLINQALPGTYTVATEWNIFEGADSGGDFVDQDVEICVQCSEFITEVNGVDIDPELDICFDLEGDDAVVFTVYTEGDGGAFCTAFDSINASSIEKDGTTCGGSDFIPAGGSNGCVFVYTVFFEGIPTLSQYGLAIMALLMLGVGFVGFRRFV